MLNKKRLAMMAVAASMMLPTNLAYLSVTTPVFAETISKDNATSLTDLPFGQYLEGNTYRLDKDIIFNSTDTNKPVVLIKDEVTLYLNDHSITTNLPWVFYIIDDGKLNLIGEESNSNEKIVSTAPTANSALITINTDKSNLNIKNIDLVHQASDGWGIIIYNGAKSSTVTLENTNITAMGGITVNGNIPDATNPPTTVTLTGGTITSTVSGIYQAGPSTLIVDGVTIKSDDTGIETRAGSLEVKGESSINGGNNGLEARSCGNGTTTSNAGIAIAPHITGHDIKLTLGGSSTITGNYAVSLLDPETDEDVFGAPYPAAAGNVTIESIANTVNLNSSDSKPGIAYTVHFNNSVTSYLDKAQKVAFDSETEHQVQVSGKDWNYYKVKVVDERISLGTDVKATVTPEKVTLGGAPGAKTFTPKTVEVSLTQKDGSTLNTELKKDIDYEISDIEATGVGAEAGSVKITAKKLEAGQTSNCIGNLTVNFPIYGDLSSGLTTVSFEDNKTEFSAEEFAEIAGDGPTVKFNTETDGEGTELVLDTHYILSYEKKSEGEGDGSDSEEMALLETDNLEAGDYVVVITAKEGADSYYTGENKTLEFTITDSSEPTSTIDLVTSENGTLTYDPETGEFQTLTFTPKDAAQPTELEAVEGKFEGLTLSPSKIDIATGIPEDGVKVTAQANSSYTGELTVEKNNISPSTPEVEENPLAIQFVTKDDSGQSTQQAWLPLDKETTEVTVDELIEKLPEGNYYFVEKPEDILTSDSSKFSEEVENENTTYSVCVVEIAQTLNSVTWAVDEDDAKINVKYEGKEDPTINGTLEFKGNEVNNNKIEATALNGKLVGYSVEDPTEVDLSTYKVIGYKDSTGAFKGLRYSSDDAVKIVSAPIEEDEDVTVTVGNITVTVKASQLLKEDEAENLTSEVDEEKLATVLTESDKNTQNIQGENGSSTPAPHYIYEVRKLASGDDKIDPTGEVEITEQGSTIQVKVKPESAVRFVFIAPDGESAPVTAYSLENTEEEETSAEAIVKVSTLDSNVTDDNMKISKAALEKYSWPEDVEALLENYTLPATVDLSQPQDISNIEDNYLNVEVELGDPNSGDDNGNKGPATGGNTNKKPKPKPEEPTTPVVGTPTTMYRLYNKLTGEHLYTIDKNERDNLLTSDTWKDEGQGWIAPSVSDYPVYRLLNPNNGDHHYTTDKNEFDTLPTYGWVAEGVAFFSADKNNTENVILHRLYNPNAEGAGSHHYTADTNERDTLVAQGWKYEGTAWAGLPANK